MNKTVLVTLAAIGGTGTIAWALYPRALTPPEQVSEATCADAPNGTACGAVPLAMECFKGACGKNLCGDGVVLGDDQCDDGNIVDGDGCSAKCRWEPLAECGNGKVDPREECDDGNAHDEDSCTLRCTTQRCGDGAKTKAETCDDGNADDTDGCNSQCRESSKQQLAAAAERVSSGYPGTNEARADQVGAILASGALPGLLDGRSAPRAVGGAVGVAGGGGAGASAGGTGGARSSAQGASPNSVNTINQELQRQANAAAPDAEELCNACRNQQCRHYQDTDLVAGCYEAVNPQFGASPDDASFLAACQDVMECAQANGCGYDREQASRCYCGSASIDECAENGPAKDAPCVTEWQIATRSEVNLQVLQRMSVMSFPAAWAFHLLECERTMCPACAPKT